MVEDPVGSTVRAAAASLMQAALRDLAGDGAGAPTVERVPDLRAWWRCGQESFVALRPDVWRMPERVALVGWLDRFAEMRALRDAFEADQILGPRVDTMVGAEFSLQYRRLERLLVEFLLDPMVVASRSYGFDDEVFDSTYRRLEFGLRADTIRFIEFIPFNGFISALRDVSGDVKEITLPDGLVMRPMTDRQMSMAIRVLAVPSEFAGGPNTLQVSRFHQWALTRVQAYPLRSYKLGMPAQPQAPDFPRLIEPAQRLITALRVVCGGSVIATRPIHAQHDDDFPPADLGSSVLLPLNATDLNQPTHLVNRADADRLGEVYSMLASPGAEQDRALQVALRRFVFAGSRSYPPDRLIDLSISAEALFIQRSKIDTQQKGALIAEEAANLLAGDALLGVDHLTVKRFFRQAYRLRNEEIHGGTTSATTTTLLDGTPTANLAAVVDDLARVQARAIQLVLGQLAAAPAVNAPEPPTS